MMSGMSRMNGIQVGRMLRRGIILVISMLWSGVTFAVDERFQRKGSASDYFDNMHDAFDISILGDMLFNFYTGIRDEETAFTYLMATGDRLLLPILGPLIIICAGVRLMQEMGEGGKDVFSVIYATAAVILVLALYRTAIAELTALSNTLVRATTPNDYSFRGVMEQVEGVVTDFNETKKNKDPIAILVDKTVSLYTQYFMAWGTKWGVLIMHGLLNYLRNTLYAINYVLGIFLLPFFIIKQNKLPRNWLMITAFIFLWGIVESIMVAVMGQLGVGALKAALQVEGALPIFSESLFYVMVSTINILIGVAMLSSIWIVKSYLLSPTSISTVAALFTLPAISLARMSAGMGASGALAAAGVARSTVSGAKNPMRSKGGGGYGRYGGGLPPLSNRGSGGTAQGKTESKSTSAGGPKNNSADSPPDLAKARRPYKMRSIIEHSGKLEAKSLPKNISAISRVGKKHKVK